MSSSSFNHLLGPPKPKMGLTENQSPSFLSSNDACLDFFFQVVPNTPSSTTTKLLGHAWEQNPSTALKLVCHLRGVRGTGKSDREGFYACALWIHKHHSKTVALNVGSLAEFGYLKDLPMILYRIMHGTVIDRRVRRWIKMGGRGKMWRQWRYHAPRKTKNPSRKRAKKEKSREERIAAEEARVKIEIENAAKLRRAKRAELAKKAIERYRRDPDYRFLHDRVADLFASLLAADLDLLKLHKPNKISLTAKWCPSLDYSFDRSTLVCESIARRIFPKDSNLEYVSLKDEYYAYRVRDRLRKEVLVPLRKVLQLPEVYMSAGNWDTLPYDRVPSVAMRNYTKLFKTHDRSRFSKYLAKVKKGEGKIAAGALLPHDILNRVISDRDARDVAELQWERMVKDLSEKGRLENSIAVCDVSGSMTGEPMEVCVALGLLISELSQDHGKGECSHSVVSHAFTGSRGIR